MKIPIFEEILYEPPSFVSLINTLKHSNVGKLPTYINLLPLNEAQTLDFVGRLEDYIFQNNLNPLFPYPIYLVTHFSIKSVFPHVKNKQELPEFFFTKARRPGMKDMQLLHKLEIKIEKIKNIRIFEMTDILKENSQSQRHLYNLSKQLHFLEFINQSLKERK